MRKLTKVTFFATSYGSVAMCLFLGMFLSGCGGGHTKSSTSPQLTQLIITPEASEIALGQSLQYKATMKFADGTSRDVTKTAVWTSDDTGVASVGSTGILKSHSVGKVNLTAIVGNLSGLSSLVVSKAAVVSIEVGPPALTVPLGATAQVKAIATYTDGSRQDVTQSVSWQSSDPHIAVVSNTGIASGGAVGSATVIAVSGSAKAYCQLTVLPATLASISVSADRSTIPLGSSAQFTARGLLTDGSTTDLTTSVSWSYSPPGVLAINSSGLATGRKTGLVTVKAGAGSIEGIGALTVSPAQLMSLLVSSPGSVMPLGTAQHLVAEGTYTDGGTRVLTNSVLWSSDSRSVVSVSSDGEAVAKAAGTALITATIAGISQSVPLTVSAPALVSMTVSPTTPTIPLGSSLQLTTIGSYSDGSTLDLTKSVAWIADDEAIVQLSEAGKATAQRIGSTGVRATFNGVAGATTIIVQPVAMTNYFSTGSPGIDSTVRIVNPGSDGDNSCVSLYVFDQDQQMTECCGCYVSPDGLRTLSLRKDLTANPLTGVRPSTGSLVAVTADHKSNPSCNAASITPGGSGLAWATHIQKGQGASAISETSFSQIPLSPTLASALQAQCQFIQELGSGSGVCGCGTGDK